MKVALAHFSHQPRENPYVWSLGTALQRLGFDVQPLPASAFFLIRYASARQASIIHFQWFETLVGANSWLKMAAKSIVFLLQARLCRLLGKRLVWTVHNAKSHEQKFAGLERWVVSRIASVVHSIIVHCDRAKSEITDYIPGIDPAKISVIDHGSYIGIYKDEIDRSAARDIFGFTDDDMVILFLGNIRPYKGLDDLLTAYESICEQKVRLLIAGKPLNDRVQAALESRCKDQPGITFLPIFIEDDKLQEFFHAADVVAFPYTTVLTSGALLLAMSFGKACIAPELGCIPSVAGADANYLYSPPGPEGLTTALEAAIADRERLADAGSVNYAKARTMDWDRIAEETALTYTGSHSPVRAGEDRK